MTENPEKQFYTDHRGRRSPADMVDEIDRMRDGLVRDLVRYARDMRDGLAAFKRHVFGEIEAFQAISNERFGVQVGGKKGNIQLTSYDGTRKVLVAVAENQVFDERLQAAKQLIDECLQEWTEGARDEIKVLIQDAFQVDSAGKISTWRVMGLRSLNIEDEKWLRAMRAISESLKVVGTTEFVRFYERDTPKGKWEAISLDIAKA